MGASDSKIAFKKGIFRLSQERHIPPEEPYWAAFWELPESTDDIFTLFSPADIRRARDQALENVESLLQAVAFRLFYLYNHPSFPDPDLAPERDALNCIRILTRILPFLYETDTLREWEDGFFWAARPRRASDVLFDGEQETSPKQRLDPGSSNNGKPLAEELIDVLVDLLFCGDFTLPKQMPGQPKVSYSIWQSGVGCNISLPTTKEHENNRSEVLRLLLVLASQSMYMTPAALSQNGVKALTYICTSSDKQIVLSVLCSLLNTTLKYNPSTWRVPYTALRFRDGKQMLVTCSLQYLLILLLYPIPQKSNNWSTKNYYRHFLGRLHRPQDFQFILDGMTKIIHQPLQEKTSYLPGSRSAANLVPDILMLFWELTQCNKRFRSFIIGTERAHDFVVLTLFYALEYKADASKQGVVRMCVFLLQTISVESKFGTNLNKEFEVQEQLPASIRLPGFKGTYADFLIQSIFNLISSSHGTLSAIYPALLAVINNVAPYLEGVSGTSSARLLQLLVSMSSPSFLLASEANHSLLKSLLESINAIVEHQYKKNPDLIYAIVRNRKRIEELRTFTLENGQMEMEEHGRRRKAGTTGDGLGVFQLNSARSSVEIRSTADVAEPMATSQAEPSDDDGTFAIGEDDDDDDNDDDSDDAGKPTPAPSAASENPSQHSSLVNMEGAAPVQIRGMSEKARGKMPIGVGKFSRQSSVTSLGTRLANGQASGVFETTPQWIESWLPDLPLHTLLAVLQQFAALLPRQVLAAETPSRETLQRIQEIDVAGVDASPIRVHSFEWSPLALGWYESLLWGFVFSTELECSKGTAGIWNGTAIRLFRVQETVPEGPSLMSPRGAVDAVGSNIASRIGAINIRGTGALTSPSAE